MQKGHNSILEVVGDPVFGYRIVSVPNNQYKNRFVDGNLSKKDNKVLKKEKTKFPFSGDRS